MSSEILFLLQLAGVQTNWRKAVEHAKNFYCSTILGEGDHYVHCGGRAGHEGKHYPQLHSDCYGCGRRDENCYGTDEGVTICMCADCSRFLYALKTKFNIVMTPDELRRDRGLPSRAKSGYEIYDMPTM